MDEMPDDDWPSPLTEPLPEPPVEPIRPLVEEARWSSAPMAEQLLHDSQAFYADWSALHASPPYAIYHYTDAAGLTDILESGLLRASDLLYLNGSREMRYTYRLIREQLRTRWSAADPVLGEFCVQAETALDPRNWDRNLFLACFCEDGDALTQWRAHSREGGYALGLRTIALDSVGVRNHRAALRRVIYSVDRQKALIERMLDRATNVARQVAVQPAAEQDAASVTLFEFLADHALELAACFKAPAFQQEAEWRLAVALDTSFAGEGTWQVKFNVEAGHPVAYVELDISPKAGSSKSPVAEVVCGTLDRGTLAARSIGLLLKSRGNASARVRSSTLSPSD